MTNHLLGQYRNGNAKIMMFSDGTKIRMVDGDEYVPECPESMDVKICNRCDNGCAFCYANSTPNGELGDLNQEFFKTLKAFTEIAIGGGDALEHPGLVDFLKYLRSLNLIPNLTVHQNHFVKQHEYIRSLVDQGLVFGVGVSVQHVTDELLELLAEDTNYVVHSIAGVLPIEELRKLYDHNIKLLVLGYKTVGRGISYFSRDTMQKVVDFGEEIHNNLDKFAVVSFDNLAINQLEVQDWMSEEEWQSFYLGDDGQHSMYVDLVKGEFASSSVSSKYYPLMDDVRDMLELVRKEKNDRD